MKSYKCIVEGEVAGGRFQSWVRSAAETLELTGWVRNIADKKAEILVQGNVEAYAIFREQLMNEAPIVNKGTISCSALDYDKTYTTFETRG
ncbi:acylphosphatase [Pseudodesulfovibrio sp. JC047]|uniref:acylphosphatase n=1 Tax=Pseudodesulfovibrio sp. JC047 TaxID=2683199 RepID=UPI0013D05133|nr:acylphosphatase [Pseudodesulfovibrio sp. JC047]NDV18549.1 acylphosphatase [Pseudodesulfovibrio sp. JC047]